MVAETKSKFKRWIEGMKGLTPQQYLQAMAIGQFGGGVGLSLAFIFYLNLTIKSFTLRDLGLCIAIFFFAYLQFLQFSKSWTTYQNGKKMFEQLNIKSEMIKNGS